MKYSLITSFLLLSACGKGLESIKDPRTIYGVNPIFAPYVDTYLGYKGAGMYYDIPIQFADLDGDTVGVCTRWSTGWRQIEIDRGYWENWLDEGEKLEVISHELGHCDLNRGHNSAENAWGGPVSIMYPYVFGIYSHHVPPYDIASYMNELFRPGSAISPSLDTSLSCIKDIDETLN